MTCHDPAEPKGRGSLDAQSGHGATRRNKAPVDPIAVDIVATGQRWVPLNRRERRVVIARLTGRVSDSVIAQRLSSTRGAVVAVRSRMRADGTW